ncbi:hypothetical protein SUDANB95_07892 (plasmid) [Actinosynnema sp. ALI-1.44]
MPPLTSDQLAAFRRILGDEFRAARKSRKWTRKQLLDAMTPPGTEEPLSPQTLATYELGTRRLAVDRAVEICVALSVPFDELVRRAMNRAFGSVQADRIQVDLNALARSEEPPLRNLRSWALVTARQQHGDQPAVVELDWQALAALSGVAGTTPTELLDALVGLQDEPR